MGWDGLHARGVAALSLGALAHAVWPNVYVTGASVCCLAVALPLPFVSAVPAPGQRRCIVCVDRGCHRL
eukprot:1159239-Pelagomonas_calceolata.AAC.13